MEFFVTYFFAVISMASFIYLAVVYARAKFNLFSIERLLDKVLAKSCPQRIPRSGEEGEKVDCFSVYLADSNGEPFCLVKAMHRGVLSCLEWNGERFEHEREIDLGSRDFARITVTHFYGLSDILFKDMSELFFNKYSRFVYFKIKYKRWLLSFNQYLFNKKPVLNIERGEVLRCLYQIYLESPGQEVSEHRVLTRVYSSKWVRHPDKELLKRKIKLYMDSLVTTEELRLDRGRYYVRGKLLATLVDSEKDDSRYIASVRQQWIIIILTVVLALLGAVQSELIKLPVLLDLT